MKWCWLVIIAGPPPNSMNLALMRFIVTCTHFLALVCTQSSVRLFRSSLETQKVDIKDNLNAINSSRYIYKCIFSLLGPAWLGLFQTSKIIKSFRITWKRYHLLANNHSKISFEKLSDSLSWFDGVGFGFYSLSTLRTGNASRFLRLTVFKTCGYERPSLNDSFYF